MDKCEIRKFSNGVNNMIQKERLKEFWKKNEQKIVLTAGFLLVAAVAFEAGYLKGNSVQRSPIIIEKPSESPKIEAGSANTADQQNKPVEAKTATASASLQSSQNCAFIGSRNSNKYHVPSCHFAKLIKPENLVCFKSAEEAIAQGRIGDKGCIK